jgi:hypothetical protein
VWPDQRERLQRLQAAIELALAEGIRVEQMDAAAFVERELTTVRAGATTVIYHSIVWSYLTAQTRESIRASIERAGAAATETAPVAWLSFEQADPQARPHLTLTLWPGGERVKLAEAHPHGTFVIWGDAPP